MGVGMRVESSAGGILPNGIDPQYCPVICDEAACRLQQDMHQAALAALQREIQLLRAENAYLRDQVKRSPQRPVLCDLRVDFASDLEWGSFWQP